MRNSENKNRITRFICIILCAALITAAMTVSVFAAGLFECRHILTVKKWVNNGNGSHSQICTNCKEVIKTELHQPGGWVIEGNTHQLECKVCGGVMESYEFVRVAERPAGVNGTGIMEHYECPHCGDWFIKDKITGMFIKTAPGALILEAAVHDSSSWYYDELNFCIENKYLVGYDNGLFGPNDILTRSQAVTILYRLAGTPEPGTVVPYNDISQGSFYEKAGIWAAGAGVTKGVAEGQFAPGRIIARQDFITMICRYCQHCGLYKAEPTDLSSFNDAGQVSQYALEAMQWACGNGIVGGDNLGNLRPFAGITRAEAAVICTRFSKGIAGK